MIRALIAAAGAIGSVVAVSAAHAQVWMPVPIVPPLPLPPLPVADFGVPPEPPSSGDQSETTPAKSTSLHEPMVASSEAEREALRGSQFHESWYGWQTLTVDATAIGTLLLGAAIVTSGPPTRMSEPRPRPLVFAAGSLGLYAVGPSIVHVAHGHVWEGLASIALRAVMPLAGLAAGYAVAGASERGNAPLDGGVGVLLGCAGAMAADAVLLGWDRWYGRAPAPPGALFSIHASL
jgi:hypothetical protein